jgi:hypothetical protein
MPHIAPKGIHGYDPGFEERNDLGPVVAVHHVHILDYLFSLGDKFALFIGLGIAPLPLLPQFDPFLEVAGNQPRLADTSLTLGPRRAPALTIT